MAVGKLYHSSLVSLSKALKESMAAVVRVHLSLLTLKPSVAHFWRFESVIDCRSDEVVRYLVEDLPDLSPVRHLQGANGWYCPRDAYDKLTMVWSDERGFHAFYVPLSDSNGHRISLFQPKADLPPTLKSAGPPEGS